MKILALRIRNLTSLAGEISIDFEAEPLAHAGLFAITGPTGAGKSTLLDALCLALYDEMPRLPSGADVRSALRHGTGEGFAEVEFRGRDGGRYCASWKVRRARNKPNGALQAQELSLTDLSSGTVIAGRKRETLHAIQDKVGLDYQQFRRSVLLAQNDFDAFLRAKPDERASLLELMTGTRIYGEISKATFERNKEEDIRLTTLRAELDRINALDDDSRAAVEQELEQHSGQLQQLSEAVEGLQRESQWYQTARDLAERLQQAEQALVTVQQQQQLGQPERDRIAACHRALPLIPQVQEVERRQADSRRLQDDITTTRTAHQQAEQARQQAETAWQQAREQASTATESLRLAQPVLEQASVLDSRLSDSRHRLQQAMQAAAASASVLMQRHEDRQAVLARRAECADDLARQRDWLDRHHGHRLLAEQADRWLDELTRYSAAHDQHQKAEQAEAEALSRLHQQQQEQAASADRLQAAETAVREEQQAVQRLEHQLASLNRPQLERQREHLEQTTRLLDQLAALLAATAARAEQDDKLARREQAHTAEGHAARQQEQDCTQTLGRLVSQLQTAEQTLRRAEAAASEQADILRQHLHPGEPCPVCGAREHATEQIQAALLPVLAPLREQVAHQRQQQQELIQQQASARAAHVAADQQLAVVQADRRALRHEQEQASAQWLELRQQAAPLLPAPLPAALSPSCDLSAPQQASQQARSALEADWQSLLRYEADLQASRQRLSTLQGHEHEVRQQHAGIGQTVISLQAALEASRQNRQQTAEVMAASQQKLAAPCAVLPGWDDDLAAPQRLAERIRQIAGQWHSTVTARDTAIETLAALDLSCERAEGDHKAAQASDAQQRQRVEQEQQALHALQQERAPLFEGRPTSEVRQAMEGAQASSQQRMEQAQQTLSDSRDALAALSARLSTLETACQQAAADLTHATEQCDRLLNAAALTLADIEAAHSARDSGWLAAAEQRQQDLRDQETRTRTLHDERLREQAAHLASGAPTISAEELQVLLPQRQSERDQAQNQLGLLRQRLADDDRNRAASAEIRQRIGEQQQCADLWKAMADLIGSADGKKFRMFAQGLTLDRLLLLANHHLADLTPRYLLQRASGDGLDLDVIDRDMADDVRAVANLSGGERFLVSLALALGLASMTGAHSLTESLFIDEGFGALDAESLDIAIAALETLQASGRKVGIISHVQAMIDRIGVQVRISKQGGGRSMVEVQRA
ncbi:AAA family ATPase [Insolitispirillum peregrinum]|uniref:Exonuclease SbcC n=1 Tax=Insolitispirillum peregrinum TaxID=80876 RepID=A0A1N7LNR6_9PROT|nr:AAA family ATPase [Insolitispirillum peregrinum]SIS75414.1 exonuclease SbcC [Insolitispirillum peregrinum]